PPTSDTDSFGIPSLTGSRQRDKGRDPVRDKGSLQERKWRWCVMATSAPSVTCPACLCPDRHRGRQASPYYYD
ncbi:MAG: hypothetical protein QME51_02610, partial [Planctomycetota bacterium]|nr:hypothetical protein [Planctomycetota bacterium]